MVWPPTIFRALRCLEFREPIPLFWTLSIYGNKDHRHYRGPNSPSFRKPGAPATSSILVTISANIFLRRATAPYSCRGPAYTRGFLPGRRVSTRPLPEGAKKSTIWQRSARATRSNTPTVGFSRLRSRRLTYVRSIPASTAKASCDKPRATRMRRIFRATSVRAFIPGRQHSEAF